MAKMKIKLLPDGSIQMETDGIKGKKCMDYAQVFEKLTDAKIDTIEKTREYYETEEINLDDTQYLNDN